MSGQAGILYDDGRLVSPEIAHALGAWNRQRGPDACGHFASPGFAMWHWALHVDALAARERQPCHAADGSVLTFDGRLDNRDDLLVSLDGDLGSDCTDAAIVSAAYSRWGTESFQRLTGDWSLAVWTPALRRLLLAADPMATRPLHYIVRPDAIAYSTCLETLVATFDRYQELDEDYLSNYLMYGTTPYRTPYAGILPVRGGHIVLLQPGAVPAHVAFRSLNVGRIRYRHQADYAEQLRVLFMTAVRDRLRAKAAVWTELSGGLDSSCVVSMASTLVRRRLAVAPAISPVSHVYSGSLESDERSFIRSVEDHCALRSVTIDHVRPDTLEDFAGALRPFSRERAYEDIAPLMAAAGSHIILTGRMGDTTMAEEGSCASQVEYLYRGHGWRFVVACAIWARRTRRPALTVIKEALSIFAPPAMRERARERRLVGALASAHRTRSADAATVFALTPQTVERARMTRMAVPDAIRELPLTKREFGRAVWYWSASNELTTPDGLDGIRTTHPYADSRLLDFMLAIPEAVRWQPDQKRALMRQALGSFLPELVRDRKGKGFSMSAIVRTIRPLAMRLHGETRPPEIVERGYVDRREWTRQLEALINGSLSNPGQIEKLMQVEAWLRGLAARRARGRRVVAQAGTSQGKEVNDNVCKA